MVEFNYPSQREKDSEEKTGSSRGMLYKPLPAKAGSTENNGVIIPLVAPARWKMFNPTVEMAQKHGLVGSGLIGVPADLGTPYMKFPTHTVAQFQYPSGRTGMANIICPLEMNKYLDSLYPTSDGAPKMFASPHCAFCEQERMYWDQHDARWNEMGIDKWDLTPESRREYVERDQVLKQTRSSAYKFRAFDKIAIQVFDHDKFMGKRPLEEGEQLGFRLWFAPKAVFNKLRNFILQDEQVVFWDVDNSAGVPIITIVKDTENCTPSDMMRTKYDIIYTGNRHVYEPTWVQYLSNLDAMVDPTDYLQMLTYEEQRFYVDATSASSNNFTPAPAPAANVPTATPEVPQVPATPPIASPPVATPETSVAPPQAAPAPPQAPETPQGPSAVAPPQASPLPQGAPAPVAGTVAPPQVAPPQVAPPQAAPAPPQAPETPQGPPQAEPPIPQLPQQNVPPVTASASPPVTPNRNAPPGAPVSGPHKW